MAGGGVASRRSGSAVGGCQVSSCQQRAGGHLQVARGLHVAPGAMWRWLACGSGWFVSGLLTHRRLARRRFSLINPHFNYIPSGPPPANLWLRQVEAPFLMSEDGPTFGATGRVAAQRKATARGEWTPSANRHRWRPRALAPSRRFPGRVAAQRTSMAWRHLSLRTVWYCGTCPGVRLQVWHCDTRPCVRLQCGAATLAPAYDFSVALRHSPLCTTPSWYGGTCPCVRLRDGTALLVPCTTPSCPLVVNIPMVIRVR